MNEPDLFDLNDWALEACRPLADVARYLTSAEAQYDLLYGYWVSCGRPALN